MMWLGAGILAALVWLGWRFASFNEADSSFKPGNNKDWYND